MDSTKRVVQVQAFVRDRINEIIQVEMAVKDATHSRKLTTVYAWGAAPEQHLRRRTNAYQRYKQGRSKRRKDEIKDRVERRRYSETHLWSVKRMRMSQNFWGSNLEVPPTALRPASKSPRFMLNKYVNSCVIHDMSYTGKLINFFKNFKHIFQLGFK